MEIETHEGIKTLAETRYALSEFAVHHTLDTINRRNVIEDRTDIARLNNLVRQRRTTVREFSTGENLYFYDGTRGVWVFGTVK